MVDDVRNASHLVVARDLMIKFIVIFERNRILFELLKLRVKS